MGSNRYVLRVDGAARGNPGPGGGGAVLFKNDAEIKADYQYFGENITNNEAEYRALLLGLKMISSDKHSNVTVQMDSELIVRQLQGEYNVNNDNLEDYWKKVYNKMKNFEQINFQHIPRKQNKRADQLANKALNEVE